MTTSSPMPPIRLAPNRSASAAAAVHVVDVEVEVDAARPVGDRLHLEPRVAARWQQRGELVVVTAGRGQRPPGDLGPEGPRPGGVDPRGVEEQPRPADVDHRVASRCSRAGAHPLAPPRGALGRCRELLEPLGVDLHPTDRQRTGNRHERRHRDVTGEQRDGAQPAGVLERRQGSGERDPGGDADAGVERRRHHRGQPTGLDDRERRAHPTQRRHLDHDDVGRLEVAHPQRVLGLADGLVCRDGHVDPVARQRHPQVAQLLDRRARLLGVLEVVGGEATQGGKRVVDRPRAVGVDAHPRGRPHHLAHRGDPGEVVVERLAALGHLDLGRGAPGEPRQHPGDLLGPHRRHGRVDRHRATQRDPATRPTPTPPPRRATATPRPARTRGTARTPPTRRAPRTARPRGWSPRGTAPASGWRPRGGRRAGHRREAAACRHRMPWRPRRAAGVGRRPRRD